MIWGRFRAESGGKFNFKFDELNWVREGSVAGFVWGGFLRFGGARGTHTLGNGVQSELAVWRTNRTMAAGVTATCHLPTKLPHGACHPPLSRFLSKAVTLLGPSLYEAPPI